MTPLTCLVVDDVEFTRVTVSSLLVAMGHAMPLQAANGAEAIEKLTGNERIDVVIADFNMPVLHGLQLLQTVRAGRRGIARGLPFVMITGHSEQHLLDAALALDVSAFLIKPVSRRGLEKRLQRMRESDAEAAWLKPAKAYAAIDVDSIRVGAAPGPDAALEKPASDGGAGPDGARGCALEDVPENAVLTRDIHTTDGLLYREAGEVLTSRVIAMLHDLKKLGHQVGTVWIAE